MVALKCLLITFTSSCAFSMMLCKNTVLHPSFSAWGKPRTLHNLQMFICLGGVFISMGVFISVCVFQECAVLSWPQRVSVVKDASEALQFLHCPPEGEKLLIHGDVKR